MLLVIWAVLLGVLAIKPVWSRLGGRSWLPSYLNLLIAVVLLVPTYELVSGLVQESLQGSTKPRIAQASSGGTPLDCSNTPDIYYIILDGYGRADMLEQLYSLDNQSFTDYLTKQGFYVATNSYTNYIQTAYSIPSSLNFDFIEAPVEGENRQRYFSDLIRHNQIMAVLKRCGYWTAATASGFMSRKEHKRSGVAWYRGAKGEEPK